MLGSVQTTEVMFLLQCLKALDVSRKGDARGLPKVQFCTPGRHTNLELHLKPNHSAVILQTFRFFFVL